MGKRLEHKGCEPSVSFSFAILIPEGTVGAILVFVVQLSLITSSEEPKGFSLDLLSQLLGFIQIFQYVDVGSKKDHVLLPTAIGHMEKVLCVSYG